MKLGQILFDKNIKRFRTYRGSNSFVEGIPEQFPQFPQVFSKGTEYYNDAFTVSNETNEILSLEYIGEYLVEINIQNISLFAEFTEFRNWKVKG